MDKLVQRAKAIKLITLIKGGICLLLAMIAFNACAAYVNRTVWVKGHWYQNRWIPGHYVNVRYYIPTKGTYYYRSSKRVWVPGYRTRGGRWVRGYWR